MFCADIVMTETTRRHGGTVSNMTLNLYDEGENTWDYEDKSPDPNVPLGKYRYDLWGGGTNTVCAPVGV